ncbi:MAG: glycosyl hydrolase [Acidobacteriota bacterium]
MVLMKRSAQFLKTLAIAAPAFVLLLSAGLWIEDRGREEQRTLEINAPNQWFFQQRAFPQNRIPLKTWRQAREQALTHREAARWTAPSWTPRGPENIGGRITDIAVDPSDDDIVYAGAAEGGVFKTTDGGLHWAPVFDDMPALSIGALAIDPSDTSVVYAGTGEVNPGGGSLAYGGAGLFRSSDQGATWTLAGLENSGSIGRIVIDPDNSQRLFVAAMGLHWQGNPERGVYRTTDGGTTWERVLYVDDQTGCVDIVQRPDNPNVLFAAMWQRIRQPEYYDYGGPGCAVYKTIDGGDSWTLVEGGLPAPSVDGGRIGLSLCAGQPDVMHAVYADRVGYFDGLYRSEDGGGSWARTTDADLDSVFASYGWWFGNVRTHPTDPDTIYVLGLPFWRSTDGGDSYHNASGGMHVDHHALGFGSGAGAAMYNGNDGGVYRSVDGAAWTKLPNLPLTQVYRMAVDQGNNDALYIGAQDNGTNRTLTGAIDDWVEVFGGDGMQAIVHPDVSTTIWAMYQYGNLFVTTNDGASWLNARLGIGAGDRKGWNAPHIQDPTDVDTRYFGSHRVYRNTDDRNWTAVSPDLTGGPHQNNSGQVDGSLTSLAVSPLDAGVIWSGSNDGFVFVTTDGGGLWTDRSATLPERWVTSVRTDPFNRETAYVTISGYRWAEPLPHVFRTTDLGASWQPIAGDLPEVPVNDFLADPEIQDRYFVATDLGVYETLDGGISWTMLGANLPNVVTTSLVIDTTGENLVVGTFGRSTFAISLELERVFLDGFETGDTSRWSNGGQ